MNSEEKKKSSPVVIILEVIKLIATALIGYFGGNEIVGLF